MKKFIKTITTVAVMGIMVFGAYYLGTTQAKTITKVETKTVTKEVEVVPDGYIKLDECIPLSDIACYFIDEYDYPCFELKDVGNQLDNPNNRSYADIMKNIPCEND